MSLWLKISIPLILFVTLISIILAYFFHDDQILTVGQLIILAYTLISIIKYTSDTHKYTSDTHRIANVTEQKWESELMPKLMYEIWINKPENQSDTVNFQLINPTDYLIDVVVNCNFKINGESVIYAGAYDGTETWTLFPHQISRGYFSIDLLLNQKNMTRSKMIEERNDSNESEQLTMDLEFSFKNEMGRERTYPKRRHHFSFDRWTWIPVITRQV